jgi:hypothetical protein
MGGLIAIGPHNVLGRNWKTFSAKSSPVSEEPLPAVVLFWQIPILDSSAKSLLEKPILNVPGQVIPFSADCPFLFQAFREALGTLRCSIIDRFDPSLSKDSLGGFLDSSEAIEFHHSNTSLTCDAVESLPVAHVANK